VRGKGEGLTGPLAPPPPLPVAPQVQASAHGLPPASLPPVLPPPVLVPPVLAPPVLLLPAPPPPIPVPGEGARGRSCRITCSLSTPCACCTSRPREHWAQPREALHSAEDPQHLDTKGLHEGEEREGAWGSFGSLQGRRRGQEVSSTCTPRACKKEKSRMGLFG